MLRHILLVFLHRFDHGNSLALQGDLAEILKAYFSKLLRRVLRVLIVIFFQLNATKPHKWEVNIGSGIGLVPPGALLLIWFNFNPSMGK